MPSIKNNIDFFKKAKEMGAIKPTSVPEYPLNNAPDVPSYPNAPNSYLRSTLPANLIQSPDGQRQYFNPATPQTRLFAPTLASSAFNGSAIQSGVITTSTSTMPIPPVVPFPPSPSANQLYEVNLNGIFEEMYSVNGTVLP